MSAPRRHRKRAASRLIHYRPLGSGDAQRIAGLQRRLFPPELTESVGEIRDILRNTEQHLVCNLSFGLFDNTRMVGYVFAYVETRSIFHKRDEDVIYVKEIALLPGYEHRLRQLFFKLYEQWIAFTPGMPLEAHVLDAALESWRRLARLSGYFGVTMTDVEEVRQEGRPPYNLLRMDVGDDTQAVYTLPKKLPAPSYEHASGVTATVVTDPRQWLSLRAVWDTLLEQTRDANVFQSFEYLWQWWRHFGFWNDLYIVVLRRGETVIGIVPFMREYFPILGKVARKLLFMTAPMEMNRPKLVFGRNSDLCWPVFLDYMMAHTEDWDILDIDEQCSGEKVAMLRDHVRSMNWLIADSETVCPYIELAGTWDAFLSRRSHRMRGNIKRSRRRLAGLGNVDVRHVCRWPDLDASLDLHCEIEERSWKADKDLHLSADKATYFYYRSLARSFGADGRFEQRILECGGKPIASTFGLVHDGEFHSLKIAHDKRYDRYSPGTVLESYELESLFDTDLRRYDFMGSFLTNKLRWTSKAHRTENIHIYQRRLRLMLFYLTFFVVKRRVVTMLKKMGQFERADRFLKRFRSNPFPRY